MRALTLLSALFFAASAAAQEWQAVERVEPYSVAGSTGLEIYQSIGARGPKLGVARVIAHTEPDWQPLALIDTRALAKHVLPGRTEYSLLALVRDVLPESAGWTQHRAAGDALVTAHLFLRLASILEEKVDLTFLTLVQIARANEDTYLRSQQGSLF